MNLLLCIETGLREIVAHKFRSFLSMLGIVLGVSSLVATMALTAGIERGTRVFMEQVGGLEFVRGVKKEISGEMFDFWNLSPGQTIIDAEAIKTSVPFVSHVSPEIYEGAQIATASGSDRKRVAGVWPDNFVVARHELQAGRFIVQLDVERAARSVVIGDTIARNFWPGLSAQAVLGRTLRINDAPFVVVGVLSHYMREREERRKQLQQRRGKEFAGRNRGWDPFREKNEAVIIPFSTMFYEFKSGLFPDDSLESMRLETMTLRVGDLAQFRPALERSRAALMQTHRGVDDFDFETREEWFDRMESNISATRMSGGLIAAISLVVGGIGIANIMLASITERVREIGTRMAVGAKGRDIFLQILIESVGIAFIGGLLGVVCGMVLIQVLNAVAPSENEPVMTFAAVWLSVAFAVLAGVISGIYPALRAASLDPIEALRYE